METSVGVRSIGDLAVKVESEMDDLGNLWDTRLTVSGDNICWISGEEIESFFKDMNVIIDKYRI